MTLMTEIRSPWPAPRPLPDALPPVPAFEPELLPEAIQSYVLDVSQRMQSPPDYAAVVAVCALSAMLGRKALIRPKQHDDWTVTPTAWGALIGGPSTMKSPNLAEMLKPVHAIEAGAAVEWGERIKLHKAEAEAAEIAASLAKSAAKKLMQDGRKEEAIMYLAASEEVGQAPALPRIIVNDASVEALGERLQENPNGLLLVRDELSGWISTMMQEDRQSERAFFLEAFNGNASFTYDRIGRGTVRIEHCTLSVVGGIQPSKIAPLVRGAVRGTADDGLIQRLQLAVWPDPVRSWRWIDRAPDPRARARYFDAFERLHAMEMPAGEDGPPCLRFTPEAQAMFVEWMEELQIEARGDAEPPAQDAQDRGRAGAAVRAAGRWHRCGRRDRHGSRPRMGRLPARPCGSSVQRRHPRQHRCRPVDPEAQGEAAKPAQGTGDSAQGLGWPERARGGRQRPGGAGRLRAPDGAGSRTDRDWRSPHQGVPMA